MQTALVSGFEVPLSRIPDPVQGKLRQRGVTLDTLAGENTRQYHDRLDTALMELFRDTRDTAVFEALYGHARGAVLDWLRRLLREMRCALDPTDLIQDTFVNVYRYSRRFRADHRGSFRVWVRTIAANVVRRTLSIVPRSNLQALPEGVQEPADQRPEPDAVLVDGETRRELTLAWMLFLLQYQRAYAQLSERDQRALRLIELEGCSYRDAGAELQVGHSNMKMIVFRARQRIQLRMRRAMGEAE